MTTQELIFQEMKRWRGVPYRIGGSGYKGVDCSGLIIGVLHGAGLWPTTVKKQPLDMNAQGIFNYMKKQAGEIAVPCKGVMNVPIALVYRYGKAVDGSMRMAHVAFSYIRDGEHYTYEARGKKYPVQEFPWRKGFTHATKIKGL